MGEGDLPVGERLRRIEAELVALTTTAAQLIASERRIQRLESRALWLDRLIIGLVVTAGIGLLIRAGI